MGNVNVLVSPADLESKVVHVDKGGRLFSFGEAEQAAGGRTSNHLRGDDVKTYPESG